MKWSTNWDSIVPRFPTHDCYPKVAEYLSPSGVLAPAERATAEKGLWLLADHIEQVTKAVREGLEE